jgi:hypothetical protein
MSYVYYLETGFIEGFGILGMFQIGKYKLEPNRILKQKNLKSIKEVLGKLNFKIS